MGVLIDNLVKYRLQGLHAISINFSYRATLALLIQERDGILINIGDHDRLY
jgi:hypothetical protein